MNTGKPTAASLYAAGILSLGMGSFHLFLPRVFGWAQGMRAAPSSLQWALASLNAFWSLLILITGILAIAIAWRQWWLHPAGRSALAAMACYWTLHALYLVLWPFPLPPSLVWLGRAFVGFAAMQAVLHGWPLLAHRTSELR